MTPPPSSDQLAQDRTDLAEDRTLLASERTYASWLRTGMACVAVGLGFRWMLREFQPAWAAKLVATAFVVAAVAIILFAAQRWLQMGRKLHQHRVNPLDRRRMVGVTALVVCASVALAVMVWVVD